MRAQPNVCRRSRTALAAHAAPLQSSYPRAPAAAPAPSSGGHQQRDSARAAPQSLQQAYEAASTSQAEPFSTELFNQQYSNAVTLTGSLVSNPEIKSVGSSLLATLNLRIKQGLYNKPGWCDAIQQSKPWDKRAKRCRTIQCTALQVSRCLRSALAGSKSMLGRRWLSVARRTCAAACKFKCTAA